MFLIDRTAARRSNVTSERREIAPEDATLAEVARSGRSTIRTHFGAGSFDIEALRTLKKQGVGWSHGSSGVDRGRVGGVGAGA
jgi:hypothetical protein